MNNNRVIRRFIVDSDLKAMAVANRLIEVAACFTCDPLPNGEFVFTVSDEPKLTSMIRRLGIVREG